MAVHDGPVDALDRVALELPFQAVLRRRVLGEHDQARRVAIDAVDDERPALAVRTQMRRSPDRRSSGAPPRRSSGTASRPAGLSSTMSTSSSKTMRRSPDRLGRRAPRALPGRSIQTRTRSPAARRVAAGILRGLDGVDEHLAAIERDRRAPARPEASGLGEKLVEPQALLIGTDGPFHLLEFRAGAHSQTRRGDRLPRRRHSLRARASLPVSVRRARSAGPALWNPYAHLDRHVAARQPARARTRVERPHQRHAYRRRGGRGVPAARLLGGGRVGLPVDRRPARRRHDAAVRARLQHQQGTPARHRRPARRVARFPVLDVAQSEAVHPQSRRRGRRRSSRSTIRAPPTAKTTCAT